MADAIRTITVPKPEEGEVLRYEWIPAEESDPRCRGVAAPPAKMPDWPFEDPVPELYPIYRCEIFRAPPPAGDPARP